MSNCPADLQPLADVLGASIEALCALGVTRNGKAWRIPERNGFGEISGYALRLDNGEKSFETGGHRGLTMIWPLSAYAGTSAKDPIICVEGMSDTAIGLDLGYVVIGRPSATGGLKELRMSLHGRQAHVLIVGENDASGTGREGATSAADTLTAAGCTVKIIYPPLYLKDLREWVTDRRNDGKDDAAIKREIQDLAELSAIHQVSSKWKAQNGVLVRGNEHPNDWPEPGELPAELPAVLPYDPSMLPGSFGSFVSDVSERMQCPPDYPAASILCVAGSAIGRRCAIRPKRMDDFTVVPNVWGGVIGTPSMLKTPGIRDSIGFLNKLEACGREQYESDLRGHQSQVAIAKAHKHDVERRIKKAIEGGQNPFEIAGELAAEDVPEPVRRRYILNDATVEKLGVILKENAQGVMVFRDELVGLLYSLEKENQQCARAFYLEAWNGTGRFTYDRIERGTIDIDSACVSVFGGIQPDRLAPYIRSAVNGRADNDGFIQRFQVLVWPDQARTYRYVDRWPDNDVKRDVFAVINRLSSITPESVGGQMDAHDDGRIPYLRYDDQAQEVFIAWLTDLELHCGPEQSIQPLRPI